MTHCLLSHQLLTKFLWHLLLVKQAVCRQMIQLHDNIQARRGPKVETASIHKTFFLLIALLPPPPPQEISAEVRYIKCQAFLFFYNTHTHTKPWFKVTTETPVRQKDSLTHSLTHSTCTSCVVETGQPLCCKLFYSHFSILNTSRLQK